MHSAADMQDYDFESPEGVRPPALHLRALEARAPFEALSSLGLWPLLQAGPRGDGHPVLVLPGLVAHDSSTRMLREFLIQRGYAAHGWGQGINFGPRPHVVEACVERVHFLHRRSGGRNVSLVGQSLGGIYARVLACLAQDQVRCVITLGSPFAGAPRASNAWKLYEQLSGRQIDDGGQRTRMRQPPPVPATAIYSRSDGIVAWQGCLEQEGPLAENIEVEGSHCGLGHNPVVLHAIADRLAQPEGRWQHFKRSGVKGLIYPDPRRDSLAS